MSSATKKAPDKLNVYAIAVIGCVSALVMWASVVALRAYFGQTDGALEHAREIDGQDRMKKKVLGDAQEILASTGKDAERPDIAHIPIDVAKKQVLDALAAAPTAALVPAIGAHDVPTVPATWGRPPDQLPPMPAPGTPPADPNAPPAGQPGAPTDATAPGTPPADATPPAAPVPGPAAPTPAAPAPRPARPAPRRPAPAPAPAPTPAPDPAAPATP